jgi:ketosteroid isomerase-like protein
MNALDVAPLEAVLVGPSDPEIVALEAQIRAAQLTADVDALASLIADALLFTGPDGQLATKAQDLAAYRAGTVQFRKHEPIELRIRRVGTDVAVTSLCAMLLVQVNGSLASGTYRYTRMWARDGMNRWQVVAGHVSAVPSEPAREPPEPESPG